MYGEVGGVEGFYAHEAESDAKCEDKEQPGRQNSPHSPNNNNNNNDDILKFFQMSFKSTVLCILN